MAQFRTSCFLGFWEIPLGLEKQDGCQVVAHERLIETRVTMEWLLAEQRSVSNPPAFLNNLI